MSQKELSEFVSSGRECPTCGTECASERGVKIHHKKAHGESIAGVETECPVCGDTLRVKPYKLEECTEGPYCSYDCAGTDKRDRVELECEACGDSFIEPKRRDWRRFCSQQCFGDYNSGENHRWYDGGLVEVDCMACGTTLTRKRSRVEGYNRHFCDKDCESNWKKDHLNGAEHPSWKEDETTECEWCESVFPHPPSRDAKFCSMECAGKAQSERQTGSNNPYWRGGRDFYTRVRANLSDTGWRTIADRIRDEHDYECYKCGGSQAENGKKLDVHHIIPVMDGGLNEDWNLIPLCQSCHKTVEWYTVNKIVGQEPILAE